MGGNTTSHKASVYDQQVGRTIPAYDLFHEQVMDLVKAHNVSPNEWLDTGCGTGTLATKALDQFINTSFILSDPSAEMLNMAKIKLVGSDRVRFIQSGSQELNLPDESVDVLTVIMSHHYLGPEERKRATENCFRVLRRGGVFITFENIRPESAKGVQIGLERWKQFQLASGQSEQFAENHTKRFNTKYFPITLRGHLDLLRGVGFSISEVLWVSFMQAGFYAIKG